MESVQFGLAGRNMISKIPFDERISHLVSLPYAATLKPELFTYGIVRKNMPILAFIAFCKIFFNLLFRPQKQLTLRNSWVGIAVIVFLLMNPAAARVGNTVTAFSTGENVPVVDKLPPNCHPVDNCQTCFPCQQIREQLYCCDG